MELERLARELVRALRGKRSQPWLSKRLGFSTNVVHAWERGRRSLSASTFFALAARTGVQVAPALARFLGDAGFDADVTSPEGVTALVCALRGDRSVTELAELAGVDRTTVTRWLAGRTEPRLPELLRLVDGSTHRLLELVALFADPATLPSTRAAYADLLAQRHLAYELPFSHAVLRALELSAYRALPRHEPGFIARAVGISLAEEQRYLRALRGAKQVRLRKGRYEPCRVLTVDTRPDEARNRALKLHWATLAAERLAAGAAPRSALFSYNLFPIAEKDLERIRRLHLEHYERVREIIAESRGADRVVLMNLQLLPLGTQP